MATVTLKNGSTISESEFNQIITSLQNLSPKTLNQLYEILHGTLILEKNEHSNQTLPDWALTENPTETEKTIKQIALFILYINRYENVEIDTNRALLESE